MSIEDLITEIVSRCPTTSREQIIKFLEEEKNKTAGLISDSTLLRLVAHKHGVEIQSENPAIRPLSTRVLVPQLNDVTIAGRIIATFPSKSFEGIKPGKFASLIIADKVGSIRVMLWNDKADYLESGLLKTGQIARFTHAYTREDRNGKTELHLGEKSKIDTNPTEIYEKDYPSTQEISTKISQITTEQFSVHIIGRVKDISTPSTFTRQDQTSGKVMKFDLFDETGEIGIAAWNEKAEELSKVLDKNKTVQFVNLRVKSSSSNETELHADANTYVEVLG